MTRLGRLVFGAAMIALGVFCLRGETVFVALAFAGAAWAFAGRQAAWS